MNGAVFLNLVKCTESVLNNHKRNSRITVLKQVQSIAKSVRIDLPSPVGSLEVRILCSAHHVALDLIYALLDSHAVGHIIGECIEVDRAFLDNSKIFLIIHERGINAEIIKELLSEERILAAYLNITAEIVADCVTSLALKNILRIRCERIPCDVADHITDHEIRIDLMTFNNGLCGSYELIMKSFKSQLIRNFKLRNCAALCSCKILR